VDVSDGDRPPHVNGVDKTVGSDISDLGSVKNGLTLLTCQTHATTVLDDKLTLVHSLRCASRYERLTGLGSRVLARPEKIARSSDVGIGPEVETP
jgi:hypothetical protein